MTLLSKYKQYSNFITFLEHISTPKHNTLTESIIAGFNIIMEGEFLNQYGSSFEKYTHNPSREEIKQIASNPTELKKYFYGILIKLIDNDYTDIDEAENVFSECVRFLENNPNIITNFDLTYSNLESYVHLFVYRYVHSKHTNKQKIVETPELIKNPDTTIIDKSEEYESETANQGNVLDSAIEWTADALATRLAKKPNGSVDDIKHEKLYNSYYKFLQNYAYTNNSDQSNDESESILEKKAIRDELILKKMKQYQNFVRSMGKILTSQEYKFKKVLGDEFNPENILIKFKQMTSTPPEGSKKLVATSENIKYLLGDKIYDIIYSLPPQQKQINKIDELESELNQLSNLRTKKTRVGAMITDQTQNNGEVDEKTGNTLITLLKKFHKGE